MSSYQTYEFQAIDRLLTEDEQRAVARLSSRVEPHPRQAVFVYHWGSFPADPREILHQYFDALFYTASWGSRQIMFRFPRVAVDVESAMAYCQPLIVEETISFSTEAAYSLLNVEFHEEGGGEWMEEPSSFSAMLSLRDDIVRGDYRMLYLAWLKALEVEDLLDSVREPPVPPGLKALSPALHTFVDFLGIDETLIQVAAEASGDPQTPPEGWLREALAQLDDEERDAFLLRLARGEAHLSVALNRRLRALAPWPEVEPARRRTVGELVRAAETQRARVRWQRAAEAEARRIADLEALARREAQAWAEVEALIERPSGVPSGSLGAIIGNFKSVTARRINRLGHTPGAPVWQRNYYEHIVRDERALNAIRQYIADNPPRWAWDTYNPTADGPDPHAANLWRLLQQ